MHLKLERAMYVKLIFSSLSPTSNFQQKNKENNTAWLFLYKSFSGMIVVYVLLHCQYLQLLNLIRH